MSIYYPQIRDEWFAEEVKEDSGRLAHLNNKELGRLGEHIAACHLTRIGYEIVEKNYRCSEGEADIVAFDPGAEAVVLLEVKTRRSLTLGDGTYPEEAVDSAKMRRYRRIASYFLAENFPVPSIRFDVIGITLTQEHTAHVHHCLGVFDWDTKR